MHPVADLPTFLEARAFATWDRIVETQATGITPHEDGISADLLSAIVANFGAERNRIRPISGSAEGGPRKPNADWEWWIEIGGRWYGFRFQAKLIDFGKGRYPELDPLQAVRMIENRFWPGRPDPLTGAEIPVYRYPLYCLYTAWRGTAAVRDPRFRRAYGHSIVTAPRVLSTLRGSARSVRSLTEYAPHLHPLAWLFADTLADGSPTASTHWLFDADPGDRGDHPTRVNREPSTKKDDPAAAYEAYRESVARQEAAESLGRVLPPPGETGLLGSQLPPYVKVEAQQIADDIRLTPEEADEIWVIEDGLEYLLVSRLGDDSVYAGFDGQQGRDR